MRLKVFMSAGGVAIRASQLSSVKIHQKAETREKCKSPPAGRRDWSPQNMV